MDISKISVFGEEGRAYFALVFDPASSFQDGLEVVSECGVGELSVVDLIGVDAVPDAHHEGRLAVIDHEVIFELLQAFGVEELDGPLCLLHYGILEEAQLRLVTFAVKHENEADNVFVALLNVVGLGQFQQLLLLFVDVLCLQPLSHCLGRPLSLVRNGGVLVLRVKEEDCREALHLISTHKLLVLAAVDASNVHTLSNHLGELAVLWLEISAVAALS